MMNEALPERETGVIHGRFQVFHNDHLVYLLAGLALCRHLVVGITNPDPFLTRDDAADRKRSHLLMTDGVDLDKSRARLVIDHVVGRPAPDMAVVAQPIAARGFEVTQTAKSA